MIPHQKSTPVQIAFSIVCSLGTRLTPTIQTWTDTHIDTDRSASISFQGYETKSKSTHTHTHTRTSDRFLAAGTERSLGGVIVDLTMWLSFMLKVVPSGERHFTHLGEGREVTNQLWVEHLLCISSGVFYLLASYTGQS